MIEHHPTIKDIARLAGVSVMTVSRFFNAPEKLSDATRRRIEAIIQKQGYRPNAIARSMITGKTFTIGVVVPDIRNPFFNTLFHEVELEFKSLKYNLLLCNTQEDASEELRHIEALQSRQADGIILAPVSSKAVVFLQCRKIPFVLVDRQFEGYDTDYIGSDHYAGMSQAVNYLLRLGHREIGFINGPTHLYPFSQRLRAYTDALTAAGLQTACCQGDTEGITNPRHAFDKAMHMLQASNRPSAIIAANNNIGVGTLSAIQQLGLHIPDDISLLVFDQLVHHDIIRPHITCIAQPVDFIGRNAASLLLERLRNPHIPPQRAVLNPELIPGESCKPPKY